MSTESAKEYTMQVYESFPAPHAVPNRTHRIKTTNEKMWLLHKAVRAVCPGMKETCTETEIEMVMELVNSAGAEIQNDPDFIKAVFLYRWGNPEYYYAWKRAKPRMRDNYRVVGPLADLLARERGVEYAEVLFDCVSARVLHTDSFVNRMVDFGAMEILKFASAEKRANADWILLAAQKVATSAMAWRADETDRVICHASPALLENRSFVERLVEISVLAVIYCVDPPVWMYGCILDRVVELLDTQLFSSLEDFPKYLLGEREVALAFARKRPNAMRWYASACVDNDHESVYRNVDLLREMLTLSKGKAWVLVEHETVYNSVDLFEHTLKSIGNFNTMSSFVHTHDAVVRHHLTDKASVERLISPTEGLVAFAAPDHFLEDPSLCCRMIMCMTETLVNSPIGNLARMRGLKNLHGTNKDFILSCTQNVYFTEHVMDYCELSMFDDIDFLFKVCRFGRLALHRLSHEYIMQAITGCGVGEILPTSTKWDSVVSDVRVATLNHWFKVRPLPLGVFKPQSFYARFPLNDVHAVKLGHVIQWSYDCTMAAVILVGPGDDSLEQTKLRAHFDFMKNADEAVAWYMSKFSSNGEAEVDRLHVEYILPVIEAIDKGRCVEKQIEEFEEMGLPGVGEESVAPAAKRARK